MLIANWCYRIYKEIGPGERTALSKLAVEHIEKTGRPLRIAIDISIWQFQIQSGEGGKNPALRTLYYRLLKLLALSIQPFFVFDGSQKPPFKRGSKTTSNAACLPNFLTKELLKCFGFLYHTAPGEAEAECALLQKEGIVDAVLSEDVDTLMFGCTLGLRNWTAEAVRGNKGPTHVNVYYAATTKAKARLDSEGMILIALMSGGDYIPAGIPGCGIKTACEAAKAGFGHDLCKLSRKDSNGLQQWREKLERELRTNESKLFRQRHKALKIPESFPNMTVLSYYTNPVVSSADKLSRLRDEIKWDSKVNISGLRILVSEAFDWQYLSGAKKFIRGLAPALLVHRLIQQSTAGTYNDDNLEMKELNEKSLVKAVSSRRAHWNTDGTPELRITYIPADIVGLDLSTEEEGDFQGYINDVSGDDQQASGGENPGRSQSPTKKRGPSTYEPTAIEKTWVLETYVKLGVPLLVETWEEDMRNPKKFATRRARKNKLLSKSAPKSGAMDQFVRITKPGLGHAITGGKPAFTEVDERQDPVLPGIITAPASQSPLTTALSENRKAVGQKVKNKREKNTLRKEEVPVSRVTSTLKGNRTCSPRQLLSSSPVDININPWTLSKRPSDTFGFKPPTRYSALGIYPSDESENTHQSPERKITGQKVQQFHSSPLATPSRKRHTRPTTPIPDGEEKQDLIQNHEPAIDLSTPTQQDPDNSSPRKKRSPLQPANSSYMSGQSLTPKTLDTNGPGDKVASIGVEPLTLQRVNRKLEFTSNKAPPVPGSPSSDTSSLPSPSVLLSPVAPRNSRDVGSMSPSGARTCVNVLKPTKKLVALRESLEGAWKHLEPWEADHSVVKGVYRSVEVLDMTAG